MKFNLIFPIIIPFSIWIGTNGFPGESNNKSIQPKSGTDTFENKSEYNIKNSWKSENFKCINLKNKFNCSFYFDGFSIDMIETTPPEFDIEFKMEEINKGSVSLNLKSKVIVEAENNSLVFKYDEFQINYYNSENGMRQDFIIFENFGEGNQLVVRMNIVSHDFELTCDGNSLTAVNNENLKYHYKNLKAFDSNYKPLKAWMELKDNHLSINVIDSGAVYPITIDPISTVPSVILESKCRCIVWHFGKFCRRFEWRRI